MRFPELNFPKFSFKLREVDNHVEIWDVVRRKWYVLLPEEWVRQHVLHWLITKDYPKALIAVEMGIRVNHLSKRCDVVCYHSGAPLLIIECKAPEVPINQKTFDQAARYNLTLQVPYLMVTNGLQHYYAIVNHKEKRYDFLKELPNFGDY